jgi:hypothetical protein
MYNFFRKCRINQLLVYSTRNSEIEQLTTVVELRVVFLQKKKKKHMYERHCARNLLKIFFSIEKECVFLSKSQRNLVLLFIFRLLFLAIFKHKICNIVHHHHHKHPGLVHLARSVSRVTVALSIVSSVSQLFSFLMGCSEMILKGFGFVALFAGVKASFFCIHLSCLVRCQSVFRGEWSHLFCGHKGRNLPEVLITSFLPPRFFVSVRLSKSNFLTHTKM